MLIKKINKALFLLLSISLAFSSCQNINKNEIKEVSEAIENYNEFLIQLEKEINKSIERDADLDEWESAAQSLLINSEEKNNEIKRVWQTNNAGSNSYHLKQWSDVELFSLKLETTILQNWQGAIEKDLILSKEELETAVKESDEYDDESEEILERISNQIRETKRILEELNYDIQNREKEIKKNPEILLSN